MEKETKRSGVRGNAAGVVVADTALFAPDMNYSKSLEMRAGKVPGVPAFLLPLWTDGQL